MIRRIFGEGQVFVMRATEGHANPLGQLVGAERAVGIRDATLAVH